MSLFFRIISILCMMAGIYYRAKNEYKESIYSLCWAILNIICSYGILILENL